ncbi:MAG: hypothetical protein HF976_05535 [ANME-2 cluster archaeon]|nr:hypothetical protein [ANME-2 cluster archaeon]MBC2700864.1 hypothetical protein [ANME-2 cluster archaeon]MBC2709329.1 hypothetical protein [ANME-2 cluster archaeon]MBC2746858.1 hypothetical protein [ANME-2 cluster archaeon]
MKNCRWHVKIPTKYSVSFNAKRFKGRTSRILRQEFAELKEWCKKSLWVPSLYHGSIGYGCSFALQKDLNISYRM